VVKKGETRMSTQSETHDLTVTRRFDAPVEKVWKAWVDPEYVKQWWGPAGFICPLAEIDFREGGRSLVCMRAPTEFGGQDMYNTWTYTMIEPMERFEYIQRFADRSGTALDPADVGIPSGVPKEVRSVNVFKAVGENETELTVTEYGFATDEAAGLSKQGLEQCLDKMAAIFARV
jgi:uncharacterized protein YndB with AHSA1/START domain